jgi:hypothetical protein
MPGWTEENFGNDAARQFIEMQAARLVTTIHDIIGSKDRIAPDDDGESMLMPCVEVLALLCERYDIPPPKSATVQTWHKAYLAAFDAGFDAMKPPAGLKAKRRKKIEQTFRWLESLSESYHAG